MKKRKKKFMKKKLKIWKIWFRLIIYLTILNSETKEKLIGLCLNRKLIESFNEDGETMYEEDEIEEDEEADDGMELE